MHPVAIGFGVVMTVYATTALAAPQVGERLPDVAASDVTGQREQLQSLVHGDRTLVVVLTDRHATERMRAWFDMARGRAPAVTLVSLVSVGVPALVPDSVARSRARAQVPEAHWHSTLFDTDHGMARRLGLALDDMPYAFALDAAGRVLATTHGTADSAAAAAVWDALR
jgi:hypothetical protein